MIRVVNKHLYSGPGEYIGRPSPLGNPFSHLPSSAADVRVKSRQAAVNAYREWLNNELNRDANGRVGAEFFRLLRLYREQGELTLICWCVPHACHAEVIRDELESRR